MGTAGCPEVGSPPERVAYIGKGASAQGVPDDVVGQDHHLEVLALSSKQIMQYGRRINQSSPVVGDDGTCAARGLAISLRVYTHLQMSFVCGTLYKHRCPIDLIQSGPLKPEVHMRAFASMTRRDSRSVQNASTPFESRGLETTLRRASSQHREPQTTPRRASSKGRDSEEIDNPCLVEVLLIRPWLGPHTEGRTSNGGGADDRRTRDASE